MIVAAAAIFSCGSASNSPAEPWPPKQLAEKLQAEAKTEVDKKIKQAITDYEAQLAKLDADSPLVKANLPLLRRKLEPLYLEYKRDKIEISSKWI